jgi:hypothetical protein
VWVNAREKGENKEKHVNGAMFLTPRRFLRGLWRSLEWRSLMMCWDVSIVSGKERTLFIVRSLDTITLILSTYVLFREFVVLCLNSWVCSLFK